MKPEIISTRFGSIQVGKEVFPHDIIIRLDGRIEKRKKKLSKKKYGTSHLISEEEARYVYEEGAQLLIIGGGQSGRCRLSPEAREFFLSKSLEVVLLSTPEAIQAWNEAEGKVMALIHVTC